MAMGLWLQSGSFGFGRDMFFTILSYQPMRDTAAELEVVFSSRLDVIKVDAIKRWVTEGYDSYLKLYARQSLHEWHQWLYITAMFFKFVHLGAFVKPFLSDSIRKDCVVKCKEFPFHLGGFDIAQIWTSGKLEPQMSQGTNLVTWLCRTGHFELVRLAVLDPQINLAYNRNWPFQLAAHYGHIDIVRLLLETPNRNIEPSTDQNLALCWAGIYDQFEIVKLLLNTPNRGIHIDNVLFSKIAVRENIDMISLLLEYYPDPVIDRDYARSSVVTLVENLRGQKWRRLI